MNEQDKLLLTDKEIVRITQETFQEIAGSRIPIEHISPELARPLLQAQLVKGMQHYEQKGRPGIFEGRYPYPSEKTQTERVGGQKRLDRPDREEIKKTLEEYVGFPPDEVPSWVDFDIAIREIEALIPDTEELKAQIKDDIQLVIELRNALAQKDVDIGKALEKQHESLVRHYNIAMKVVAKEAKKQERKRIEEHLVLHHDPEGNFYSISKLGWQALKEEKSD